MGKKPTGGDKGGGKPDYVTPEYIAAQRAKREAAKKERAEKNARLGLVPPEEAFNLEFIHRPMLRVPSADAAPAPDATELKIMTYNVLGQALIRRKLFPTNGNALKWRWRSKVLLAELRLYDADVMCLQEVDLAHLASFYVPELKKCGYDTLFHRGERKNHGLLVCWKSKRLALAASATVDYDNDPATDPAGTDRLAPQTKTRNVGLLVALGLNGTTKGIVIGTTHLFWHPHGTLERTRQTAILARNMAAFAAAYAPWPAFLAGDFNSQPFDSPYLGLCKPRPLVLQGRAMEVLEASAAHEYKASEAEEDGDGDDDGEGAADAGAAGGAADDAAPPAADAAADGAAPPAAQPAAVRSRPATVADVVRLHEANDVLLRSTYGEYYAQVHPANVDAASNGEPAFSNWAHTWRGLLDYIFVLDFPDRAVGDGEIAAGVRVLELLRLPEPAEMGPEPSGQPREGQYPSDHLCLVARVAV
ncbi:Endonuclease/exonuclease/phosphatase [Dipodascopsis tothii]|uniref:Endonuclease/exonuclease/phosphatase n=1 Tax=Dipodascopsis tothii TaxID=44089 RepID=UPI0034CEFB8E